MYFYVYDEFVQDKKYEKDLLQIENRLTDLGMSGKIARLALFRDAEEMIRDELRRGVTTVVAVGNDETVRKVLDVVAENAITFGMIPLGTPQTLATLLGIPEGIAACDVLSARIVETIDMGTVNGRHFITGVSVPDFRAELTCEGAFRLVAKVDGWLEIRNLVSANEGGSDPRDGQLEAVIRTEEPRRWGPFGKKRFGTSLLPSQSLTIRSERPITVFADGEKMVGTNFTIGIKRQTLKVITGRARMF